MKYTTFGRNSGLRVSELALGTGNFGTGWGYGAEKEQARQIFDRYVDAGGNFIDTADAYQFGQSEQLVGEFIAAERDRFVVATKYTLGARQTPDVAYRARRHVGGTARLVAARRHPGGIQPGTAHRRA